LVLPCGDGDGLRVGFFANGSEELQASNMQIVLSEDMKVRLVS
jgi:hypothetical protein